MKIKMRKLLNFSKKSIIFNCLNISFLSKIFKIIFVVNKDEIFTKAIIKRNIIISYRPSLLFENLINMKNNKKLINTKTNKFIVIVLLIPKYFDILLIKFADKFLVKSYMIKNK